MGEGLSLAALFVLMDYNIQGTFFLHPFILCRETRSQSEDNAVFEQHFGLQNTSMYILLPISQSVFPGIQ